jgi:SAM-dependent methyltransferase
LPFPDESFDFVLCASSLFFMPDMAATVREWRRVLRTGGVAGFSSFGPLFLQPLRDRWSAHLEMFGVTAPVLPTYRLEDPETCEGLLREAGFRDAGVRTEQLGYYAQTPGERMADILAGVEGMPLHRVDAETSARIQTGHLEELRTLMMPQGIWIEVPAHFAFGRRPDGAPGQAAGG